MTSDLHQLLPASPEAEIGLLGSYFRVPKETGALCAQRRATPEDFHIPHHAALFAVMSELWAENAPRIDFVSVSQRLRDRGTWGPEYGIAMSDMVTFPTGLQAGYYLDVVLEKSALRKLIAACDRHRAAAMQPTQGASVIAAAQAEIGSITLGAPPVRSTVRQLLMEVVEDLEARRDQPDILSGIESFDNLVKMKAGNFIVIAGEAKSGKTAFAGTIACNAAIRQAKRTVIFSLEMTAKELIRRFVCSEGRINMELMGFPPSDRDFECITRGNKAVSIANLEVIADCYDLGSIIATARQLHAHEPIALLVVDYIQLVEASTGRKGETRQEIVAQISRSLKRLAGELGCVVIGLSQLNDDGKLRESRAIGQDANAIVAVEKTDEGGRRLFVAAQRSGPSGEAADVRWLPQYTRFEEA